MLYRMLVDNDVPESRKIGRNGFRNIAEALQTRIKAGMIPVGRYLPTERELQSEFAASRSTIRRALGTLVDNGWATNVPSKGLIASGGRRRNRTTNIAMIDGQTWVVQALFRRFSSMFREEGYHLVHIGGGSQETVEDSLQYAVDNDFAGSLVWSHRGFPDANRIRNLSHEIPIVVLDHRIKNVSTDLVTFDYNQAAYDATAQMLRNGRKRIGVTGMLDMLDTNHDRFSGYMRALFDFGHTPSAKDILFIHTSGMDVSETDNLRRRLMDSDRPDALLVMQDEFTPRIVPVIQELGLSVPDDVALTAIGDDIDVQFGAPQLTGVAMDWQTMAKRGMELLLERITEPLLPFRHIVVPHQLVVRGSCGTPRSEWNAAPAFSEDFLLGTGLPKQTYQFLSADRQQPDQPNTGGHPSL